MEVINFIGLLCCVWLFVDGAASIDFIKEVLKVHKTTKTNNIVLKVISKLVNCCLCSGFWIGLVYYQSFVMGCLVSVSSEVMSRLISKFLQKWQY